jgi:DnaJ domain
MTESSFTRETVYSDEGNHRHYSILNIPRNADVTHIQRNFKQLSRAYHPDKSIAEKQEIAQQSFVAIKTAADVLSDPVYRIAYDCGGEIAVTLIKRSQTAQHSKKAIGTDNDGNKDENPYDDVYSMVEQAANEEEAAFIIRQVVEEYRLQRQRNVPSPQMDITCEVPLTWNEIGEHGDTYFQKDSVSLNVHSRCPLSSQAGVSWGVGSEYQHTAETNVKASIGLDYQPTQGTNITTNVAWNHRTAPELSLSTSRKLANGSVMVAAVHGNTKNTQSWNASFISTKPLMWDTLFGRVSNLSNEPAKLMATWRIVCDPAGRLRSVMATLRTLEYPIWSCRLALSNYPLKLSWRGAESNTFYASLSFGMFFPRIKLLRISSLGNKWTLKYGLKHDAQAMFTKGSMWSIVCSLQSNEFSLRIPVSLESSTPVAWIASILFAEFVDQRLKAIQWNIPDHDSKDEENFQKTSHTLRGLPRQTLDIIQKVASKKRKNETLREDGLVIVEAKLYVDQRSYDVSEVLQFWVVDSELRIPMKDLSLYWLIEPPNTNDDVRLDKSWLDSIFSASKSKKEGPAAVARLLDVRYQYIGRTYQVSFDEQSDICVPNRNATELGLSNRVR